MADEKVGLQSMFGKPDRKGGAADGMVQSEYPAHMMDTQINTLDNDITELEADLSGGRIPGEDVFEAKEQLQILQTRFDDIVISKPNYSPSEETFLHGELERMNSDLADTLYSRYDQLKGKGSIARPQQEADLNDKPCIAINEEVAKICNIQPHHIVGGKVSRNQIDKARKILCAYFGRDDASREMIRPENNASRKRPMVGYKNNAFAKRHKEIFGTDGMNPNNLPKDDAPVETTNPEALRARIAALQAQIAEKEKEMGDVNTIVPVKPVKPVLETKKDKSFVCQEEGCGFVGKMTQKGAHVLMHKKAKAKALKLAESNEE